MSEHLDSMADRQRMADAERVAAALRGDMAAFEELVRRHQRQASAVAYRLLNHRDDVMEVVQDAFLKAYDQLGSLARPERFGSWLMRIVSNLSLNRRRARALRRAASIEQLSDGDQDRGGMNLPDPRAVAPDEVVSAADLRKLIGAALDELADMQRQALVMFSIGKMPQKDVAKALGCSVEAVKWHVFTARRKLREKLKDYL